MPSERVGWSRVRRWLRRLLNGRCITGEAHEWQVESDLGYGHKLRCATCGNDGFMDYGR